MVPLLLSVLCIHVVLFYFLLCFGMVGVRTQCKLGSETASMSSISSTDESFRWHGLHGQHKGVYGGHPHGNQPGYHGAPEASIDGTVPPQSMSSSQSQPSALYAPPGGQPENYMSPTSQSDVYNPSQSDVYNPTGQSDLYTQGYNPSIPSDSYNPGGHHAQQSSLDVTPLHSTHSLPHMAPPPGVPHHDEPESDNESKMSGTQLVDSCL